MSAKSLKTRLSELDEMVAWFEQDDVDIDEAIKKFDEVTALAESIKKDLAELDNKITVLKNKFDGE